MDKIKLLDEVNNLVAKGLRKTSIELIEEYLEKVPNDPVMLKALGRIYLLEKKPNQAVKYLQLSLQNSSVNASTSDFYELDELNAHDLEYIDENAETHEGNTHKIGFGTLPDKIFQSDAQEIQQKLISPLPPDGFRNDNNQIVKFEIQNPSLKDQNTTQVSSDKENTVFNETEKSQTDIFEQDPIDADESADFDINEPTGFSDSLDSSTNENFDFTLDTDEIIEETSTEDLFEDVTFVTAYFEDKQLISEDIYEKEFKWDDLDDFDEIDDEGYLNSNSFKEVETTGKLTRQIRARQIATKIIHDFGWEIEHLQLLEQVFVEYGWGQTRLSIERELNKGLFPEELELAFFIRQFWSENSVFWISIPLGTKYSDLSRLYKIMSWPESLRIIRSFNGLPSEEEIQFLIESTYDDWYSSHSLRRYFKAFIWYLKYRTGSVRYALPGNCFFSYNDSYENDDPLEISLDNIKNANDVSHLKNEHIDIESMLQRIEQEYMVIKPESNYDYINYDVYLDNEANYRDKNRKKSNINPVIDDDDFAE